MRVPKNDDPHADLIRERGDRHEADQLAALVAAAGGEHVDLTEEINDEFFKVGPLQERAARTIETMHAGPALISQATFFDGRWQGRADVLRRIEHSSNLGDFAYEILEMKLSRTVKPYFVHQLAVYNRLLTEAQGYEPASAILILGDGSMVEVDLPRYAALHRHVATRIEEIYSGDPIQTYPEPVAHCAICNLQSECRQRRIEDDHLSLVANASRSQRDNLIEENLVTVAALADAPPDQSHAGIADDRFDLLRHQAGLQVASRDSGEPTHRHIPPEPGRGYVLLPAPDPADLFFDLEGDPYVGNDGGIEYLWGWSTPGDEYDCTWAHSEVAEKAALEDFVKLVHQRWLENPDMHVCHYAPHEKSKLRSLALKYATCEAEVDELLRGEVLVDLLAVVRQGLQVGEESYSLKKLERHHEFERLEKEVRAGGGSIVAYETWLKTRDQAFLDSIRAYNREDCVSTRSLRDWLYGEMFPEARVEFGADAFEPAVPLEERAAPPWMAGIEDLIARLSAGLPEDPADDDADQEEQRLLSYLLLYYYRENKPGWWRYFDLGTMTATELIDESDAIGGLELDQSFEPVLDTQSLVYRMTFPEQEFRLKVGGVIDPATGASCTLTEVSDDALLVKLGKARPAPTFEGLVAGGPIDAKPQMAAISEVAEEVLSNGPRFSAARSMLRGAPPQMTSGRLGSATSELVAAAQGLDESHLSVQGPPGTGKTYNGARMIVEAIRAGLTVGVTAQSHAAIQNVLRDVEQYAADEGVDFKGAYKGDGYESAHGLIEIVGNKEVEAGGFQLVAGTSWLHAREGVRESLDLLFVDEAGQLSLADAVAAATAAKSVVLLGDPQQLPQVNQADHPGNSGRSVLEHHLDGRATIGPDDGVLLTESWRMHPDVCAFVSERSYDGRLRSRDECAQRTIDAQGSLSGSGLRTVFVEHEGRSQSSVEEADAIAALCNELLAGGATVTDDEGVASPLSADDIMVVAPYNMAIRCIRDRVPDGVRVGTVDKFQGQEAPIVFFAMTCSSGDDVPRGLDFLFSRNRFNVAISRAQCMAVLVVSPRLLDADCRTLEAMELVDGACRFVEMSMRSNCSRVASSKT